MGVFQSCSDDFCLIFLPEGQAVLLARAVHQISGRAVTGNQVSELAGLLLFEPGQEKKARKRDTALIFAQVKKTNTAS